MEKSLIREFREIREAAGYVVGQRAKGALALAKAHRQAEENGWTWEWVDDQDADWDCYDGCQPEEILGCVLKDESGEVLTSLWHIGDPDRAYRYVVEAELALEALGR